MNKQIFLMIFLIIAIIAVWNITKHGEQKALTAQAVGASSTAPLASIKDLTRQSVPKSELASPVAKKGEDSDVHQQCVKIWQTVASTKVDDLIHEFKTGRMKTDPRCLAHEGKTPQANSIYADCIFDAETAQLKTPEACTKAIVFYRIKWVDLLSAGQSDYMGMSLPLLMNKIMSRFFALSESKTDTKELAKMTKALVAREPGLIEARKADMAARLNADGLNPESLEEFNRSASAALNMAPGDGDLAEMYLLSEKLLKRGENIERYISSHPESPTGYYYRASLNWDNKNQLAAIEDLEQIMRLNPSDPRYAKTLEHMKRRDPGDPFSMTVGFSFQEP